MANTLILRLSDEDSELLKEVMTLAGQKTASKAILALVRGYKYQSKVIDIADRRIQELIDQLFIRERAIEDAKAAHALLIDKTSQQNTIQALCRQATRA